MWILFDDARENGAQPRLYRQPAEIIVADDLAAVVPALERIRAGLRSGKHAAGYLAYEAGHAFDPKLGASFRQADGPLLCFGLFDRYETPDISSLLPAPESAFIGLPAPRITQGQYELAVAKVREHLFAGGFYQ